MCTFGVLGLSYQISTRRPPERGRKRAKMGAGDGKKKRENLGPPAFGPPPFEPTMRCPTPSGPLGLQHFLGLGPRPFEPHSSGLHPSAPPSLRAEALRGLHFFWVWAPAFLIFIMLLICFFLCIFKLFLFLFFFKKKRRGGGLANPKPKLVSSLGRELLPPKLVSSLEREQPPPSKPQTSLGFGEGVTTSPNPNPPP